MLEHLKKWLKLLGVGASTNQASVRQDFAEQMARKTDPDLLAMLARPRDWTPEALDAARTEIHKRAAAMASRDQADRSEGPASVRLLGEAIAEYRRALKVRTREQFPEDWAYPSRQPRLNKTWADR